MQYEIIFSEKLKHCYTTAVEVFSQKHEVNKRGDSSLTFVYYYL